MKKYFLTSVIISTVITAYAQSSFDVKDYGNFKLHSYVSADPLGDMHYIVEGERGVVILEPAAFLDNIKEFGDYLNKLNKPVEKVIANYHTAGFSSFDHSKFVMIEGMPEFIKGEVYGSMMSNFAANFSDKMDITEPTVTSTIGKNAKKKWAGVEFKFFPGAPSDFPAASILIGGKIYYTHFTPVANMHMSPLQLTSLEAVDAQLAELQRAKASDATTFIGGHGTGTADIEAINFQIAYIEKLKEVAAQAKDEEEFTRLMKISYPNVAGEESLKNLAIVLYK